MPCTPVSEPTESFPDARRLLHRNLLEGSEVLFIVFGGIFFPQELNKFWKMFPWYETKVRTANQESSVLEHHPSPTPCDLDPSSPFPRTSCSPDIQVQRKWKQTYPCVGKSPTSLLPSGASPSASQVSFSFLPPSSHFFFFNNWPVWN